MPKLYQQKLKVLLALPDVEVAIYCDACLKFWSWGLSYIYYSIQIQNGLKAKKVLELSVCTNKRAGVSLKGFRVNKRVANFLL